LISTRRKRARKAIAIREIAAAALSQLLPESERTALREAKVPARQIISLFTPDHVILHALGGPDRWFNITMTRRGPALKAKDSADTSRVAKVDRIIDQANSHARAMALKQCGQKRKPKGSIPSRPFPPTRKQRF
jgi:hypothetical protein